jgi:hypothetical protein
VISVRGSATLLVGCEPADRGPWAFSFRISPNGLKATITRAGGEIVKLDGTEWAMRAVLAKGVPGKAGAGGFPFGKD